MNTLICDADVFCYQFAFRNEARFKWDEDDEEDTVVIQPEVAKAEVLTFVDDICSRLDGDRVYFALSDRSANFRKELEPTYKGNRKSTKPELWETLRSFIESGDHGFPVRTFPRLEGDDVLGMMGTHPKHGKRAIMVTIDKDMKTIPGRVFFYNKPTDSDGNTLVHHIEPDEAVRFHLLQTLMGDPVDGYKGIPGVGPKKAEAQLKDVPVAGLWDAVVEMYDHYGLTEDDAILQARLAYILRYGDYKGGKVRLWHPRRLKG